MSEDVVPAEIAQQSFEMEENGLTNGQLAIDQIGASLDGLLTSLELSLRLIGDWIVITRRDFDIISKGLPYQLQSLLVQPLTGKWVSRFATRNLSSGAVAKVSQLPGLVQAVFERIVPCQGVPRNATVCSSLQRQLVESAVDMPFRPLASVKCRYVVKMESEGDEVDCPQICIECLDILGQSNRKAPQLPPSEVNSAKAEDNNLEAVRETEDLVDYIDPDAKERVSELLSVQGIAVYKAKNMVKYVAPPPPEPEQVVKTEPGEMPPLVRKRQPPKKTYREKDEDEDEDYIPGDDLGEDWNEHEDEDLSLKEEEEEEDFNPADNLQVTMKVARQKQKRRPRVSSSNSNEEFSCQEPGCDYKASKKTLVQAHGRKMHLKGRFYCYFCSNVFKSVFELKEHYDEKHEEHDKIVCGLCSMHIPKEEYMDHHQECLTEKRCEPERNSIQQALLKCVICGEKQANRMKLTIHLSNHAGHIYRCKEEGCDYQTKLFFGLQNHERKHKRERGEENNCFVCHLCAKNYTTQFYLEEHIRYFHEKKPDNIRCEHCGLNFERKKNYQKHCNQMHSDDPKYQCKICGRRFRLESDRKKHEFKHTGLPVGYCELCGKGLKSKSSLRTHMMAHRGEKPYKCNEQFCEYTCVSSTALSLHKRFKHRGGELAAVSKANGRM